MADRNANAVLATLALEAWDSMSARFELVELQRGQLVTRKGEPFTYLHFPVRGVVSTLAIMEDGTSVEMATTGREGMVQIGAILGSPVALAQHTTQVPGAALRISYDDFGRIERDVPAFRGALLRFLRAYVFQAMQLTACNAVHSVQKRAARWLLMCDDRNGGQPIAITQQFLAEMLGVTRPSVTTIARTLQAAGLIDYSRGMIRVQDRLGLRDTACECYRLIRNAYEDAGIILDRA